jgi:hypothetical protein
MLLALLLALSDITRSDCQEYVPRSAAQPAAGVTRVDIVARAGSLRVEGKRGAAKIVADGMACAAIEELLIAMRLKATRTGSTVTVEAMIPKGQTAAPFAHEAHLDFTVTVPMDVDVRIADTSGDIVVRHVGRGVEIADTTGDIDVDDVGGDFTVTVKKGAGKIGYKRVKGRVSVPRR